MVTFERLQNPLSALRCRAFTFPSYRPLLADCVGNSSTVAVAAYAEREPIGLALAKVQPENTTEILSLFVKPNYRNQGVGTALLDALHKELALQGCRQLDIVYMTSASSPALENILQKSGWSTPEPRRLICNFNCQSLLHLPWVQKPHRLPKGFNVFYWKDLKQQQRHSLTTPEANTWIPEDLHPFRYEEDFDPASSLGIGHQGKVVGWMLNHRISEDTVRFSSSYTSPSLQRRGRIIRLYAESIKQVSLQPEITSILWTVPFVYPTMVNFCRRFSAHSTFCEESRGVSKVLANIPAFV